jgi:hypothetical protein
MPGYVDPSIEPRSVRERKLLAEIRARGLRLERLPGSRTGVRLVGPEIDVRACGLHSLFDQDLLPPGARHHPDA